MAIGSGKSSMIVALLVVVIIGIGYLVLTQPDQRNSFEKVGDAISALPEGADKAARELESRTPADKINDAVQDAKDGK